MPFTLRQHFRKTKLCPLWLDKSCPYGLKCDYAHSVDELRTIPDLRRTKFCPIIMKGSKCDDVMCTYAHNQEELRPATSLCAYKTQICGFFARGRCMNGSVCRFAHASEELRPPRSPTPPLSFASIANDHKQMSISNKNSKDLNIDVFNKKNKKEKKKSVMNDSNNVNVNATCVANAKAIGLNSNISGMQDFVDVQSSINDDYSSSPTQHSRGVQFSNASSSSLLGSIAANREEGINTSICADNFMFSVDQPFLQMKYVHQIKEKNANLNHAATQKSINNSNALLKNNGNIVSNKKIEEKIKRKKQTKENRKKNEKGGKENLRINSRVKPCDFIESSQLLTDGSVNLESSILDENVGISSSLSDYNLKNIMSLNYYKNSVASSQASSSASFYALLNALGMPHNWSSYELNNSLSSLVDITKQNQDIKALHRGENVSSASSLSSLSFYLANHCAAKEEIANANSNNNDNSSSNSNNSNIAANNMNLNTKCDYYTSGISSGRGGCLATPVYSDSVLANMLSNSSNNILHRIADSSYNNSPLFISDENNSSIVKSSNHSVLKSLDKKNGAANKTPGISSAGTLPSFSYCSNISGSSSLSKIAERAAWSQQQQQLAPLVVLDNNSSVSSSFCHLPSGGVSSALLLNQSLLGGAHCSSSSPASSCDYVSSFQKNAAADDRQTNAPLIFPHNVAACNSSSICGGPRRRKVHVSNDGNLSVSFLIQSNEDKNQEIGVPMQSALASSSPRPLSSILQNNHNISSFYNENVNSLNSVSLKNEPLSSMIAKQDQKANGSFDYYSQHTLGKASQKLTDNYQNSSFTKIDPTNNVYSKKDMLAVGIAVFCSTRLMVSRQDAKKVRSNPVGTSNTNSYDFASFSLNEPAVITPPPPPSCFSSAINNSIYHRDKMNMNDNKVAATVNNMLNYNEAKPGVGYNSNASSFAIINNASLSNMQSSHNSYSKAHYQSSSSLSPLLLSSPPPPPLLPYFSSYCNDNYANENLYFTHRMRNGVNNIVFQRVAINNIGSNRNMNFANAQKSLEKQGRYLKQEELRRNALSLASPSSLTKKKQTHPFNPYAPEFIPGNSVISSSLKYPGSFISSTSLFVASASVENSSANLTANNCSAACSSSSESSISDSSNKDEQKVNKCNKSAIPLSKDSEKINETAAVAYINIKPMSKCGKEAIIRKDEIVREDEKNISEILGVNLERKKKESVLNVKNSSSEEYGNSSASAAVKDSIRSSGTTTTTTTNATCANNNKHTNLNPEAPEFLPSKFTIGDAKKNDSRRSNALEEGEEKSKEQSDETDSFQKEESGERCSQEANEMCVVEQKASKIINESEHNVEEDCVGKEVVKNEGEQVKEESIESIENFSYASSSSSKSVFESNSDNREKTRGDVEKEEKTQKKIKKSVLILPNISNEASSCFHPSLNSPTFFSGDERRKLDRISTQSTATGIASAKASPRNVQEISKGREEQKTELEEEEKIEKREELCVEEAQSDKTTAFVVSSTIVASEAHQRNPLEESYYNEEIKSDITNDTIHI